MPSDAKKNKVPDTPPITDGWRSCRRCYGSGRVVVLLGPYGIGAVDCRRCDGTGRLWT